MVSLIPKFYSTKSGKLYLPGTIDLTSTLLTCQDVITPDSCHLEKSKYPRKGPPDLYKSPLLTGQN